MANSPSHRFGQIVGDLLEEIMTPRFQEFCDRRGLYLDKKGHRGGARSGKKVTWEDKYGNLHDLDFVIEKNGTPDRQGRPLAFVEAAWRRYTKHSRNKAQEIQGAVLPIAEKYAWDKPFLGVILAGVFTEGSLEQMRSSGFDVALFPYETIVDAFASIGIDANFDETTADRVFERTVRAIDSVKTAEWDVLKEYLTAANQSRIDEFLAQFAKTLDRLVERVVVIPLYGSPSEFASIDSAIGHLTIFDEKAVASGLLQKIEIVVKYSNGDSIDAEFKDKAKALDFLNYVRAETGK